MVALALEGQAERGGGVGAPIRLGLADHPRQHDLDLDHLAGGRGLEIFPRRRDGAHGAQVIERVDRLGARGLEEELGDVGAALVERLDAVGEIPAVGVGLAGERDEQVRLGFGVGPLAESSARHCSSEVQSAGPP